MIENTYEKLLKHVSTAGEYREDRTGTGTFSVFGYQMRFNLQKGFPLVTTKRVWWRAVVLELLWFLKGSTNRKDLEKDGIRIWSEWGDEQGELGPVYGAQWRNWKGIDQIKQVIEQIKTNPTSRRLVVSAWNVEDIPDMALPPCHTMFQFYVRGEFLDCQLYQRSGDVFLGVPFNIASYSLLTHMIAHVTGLKPGHFVHTLGDAHIYSNHQEQVREQLEREAYPMPTLKIKGDVKVIDDFTIDNFELVDYQHHPAIKAPIAV